MGFDKKWYSSVMSFLALLKFVPLSVWISTGKPHLETKCFRQAKNSSVVKPVTAGV